LGKKGGKLRKEDTDMRLMTYPVLGLLILSFAFTTGNSFSQNMWYEETVKGYAGPAELGWGAFKASDMLWAQLRTPDGLYLAEISDLGIDTATGRIHSVVLSGIQGLGAQEVQIPFDTISKTGASIFVYNAPEDVYRFYGEAPYWGEGFYRYSGEPMPTERYASEFIGGTARSSNGEELGRIDDFVIDPMSGHVVYAVLFDVGGTEGRYATVPFSAFSQSAENAFVFNTTQQELLASPAFDWNDISNRRYAEEIYRHYGLRPYWE